MLLLINGLNMYPIGCVFSIHNSTMSPHLTHLHVHGMASAYAWIRAERETETTAETEKEAESVPQDSL